VHIRSSFVSKLGDRIRNATRPQAQAIGFVRAQSASQATMVLAVAAADVSQVPDLVKRGADVVVVGSAASPVRPGTRPEGSAAVIGAWAAGTADNEAKQFREAGFDFLVFDPDSAAATALLDEDIGYVLRLPADLTDIEVRALEGFRLDAIDVGRISGPLTVRRQIDLQRLFALTRKPLMATVSGGVSAAELQALRDTNVAVVMAEEPNSVEPLRKAIDELPPRARRKDEHERVMAFVPRAAPGAGEEDDEHDDD
jgi:hypothetical protein